MSEKQEKITSAIWGEEAEKDDPFTASKCILAGYDVYGDLLGKVSWSEYLYLLFRQQAPSKAQAQLLNDLAVAVACCGPRDHSIQAAMSAAAGGSPLASCLMAALGVGAGQLGGAREVYHAIIAWENCGEDQEKWLKFLTQNWPQKSDSIWPDLEHPPGFDPNGTVCSVPVRQTLAYLAKSSVANKLKWLQSHQEEQEHAANMPLALTGIASCAFADLGFDPQEGEMLYLLLRLPGAAALGLEQHWRGWKDYPFHAGRLKLTDDPAGAV